MPHWLRNSIVALLAGLASGCGTSGLFWVDDKLSKLAAEPKTSVGGATSTSSTALRDVSAQKVKSPVAVASKAPMIPLHDIDDAGMAPAPKMGGAPMVRTVDAEPTIPKPLAKIEAPIPSTFAIATPRAARGDRIPAVDSQSSKRTTAEDLNPVSDSNDLPVTPVTLVSNQKTRPEKKMDRDPEDDLVSAAVPGPRPPKPAKAENRTQDNAAEASAKKDPPTKKIDEHVAAEPIPKAKPAAQPKKLKLANVSLCRGIDGFGKIDSKTTAMHSGGSALVYVEVTGRGSQRTAAGVETKLNGKLRLTPKAGGPTTEWAFANIIDVAPAERTEFFCFMTLALPESLSVGDYRLEVALDDVHGGSTASEELSLRVEPSTASTK